MFRLLLISLTALLFGSKALSQNIVTMEDKTLIVKELNFNNNTPSFTQIEEEFDKQNINFTPINCVNWEEYNNNYNADVRFRIGYNQKEIYLQYIVKEDDVKAVYGSDSQSKPYTDSCVEFFIVPVEGKHYYNLEMNCIAKGTFAGGLERTGRTKYDDTILSKIRRESTLGNQAFGIKTKAENNNQQYVWKITIALPLEVFTLEKVAPLKGRSVKANFYKCGDDMPKSHYLSWNPINIEKPNFHRPDHFGTLIFE